MLASLRSGTSRNRGGGRRPATLDAPRLFRGVGVAVTRFPPEGRPTRISSSTSKIWRGALFNLRSLDLNLLTVFEATYELGTVSGAADHLALSQSATSHALSRLRAVCKDDLFARTRQGLSPTPVAKEMYPAIKQALEVLRASLAEASGSIPPVRNAASASASRIPWGRFTRLTYVSGSCFSAG